MSKRFLKVVNKRFYSTELKKILSSKIPLKIEEAKELKTKYGNHVIHNVTVEQVCEKN